jgi:uncharacterized protein (TIGR02099 family)
MSNGSKLSTRVESRLELDSKAESGKDMPDASLGSRDIIITRMPFYVARFCSRTLYWAVVAVTLLFCIAVLAVKYLVLPNVEKYQGDIVSRVAAASGMDVSATAIRGGWRGFQPYVALENVEFREPALSTAATRPAGTVALKLPKLTASLSWLSLFAGQIRFSELSADGPELTLSRAKDGLIYFAGRPINRPAKPEEDDGALLRFVLEQPGFEIQRASLIWRDEISPGPDLRFTDVGFALKRRGARHSVGFVATPPAPLARKVEAMGDLALASAGGGWTAEGTIYTSATDANVAELRRHIAVPEVVQAGYGNVRTWMELDTRPVGGAGGAGASHSLPIRAITADLHVINAQARWEADLAPLNIAKLAGRVEYSAQADGMSISSKKLELRTREGVVSSSADFSLMLQDQTKPGKARGQITANNIDLKVLAALIESFPVSKDDRALVAQYGPRGVVMNGNFSWTGAALAKPTSYKIKGALSEFGVTAHGKSPGLSGFTGDIDGDNTGGRFNIASKNLVLDMPETFRAPLKFDALDSNGEWKMTADAFKLTLGKIAFANADLAGEVAGAYTRFRADGPRAAEEKGPGTIDITGKLSRGKAEAVAGFLPNGIATTREYLDSAIKGGDIASADFVLKGPLFEFPFHQSKTNKFKVEARLNKVGFRYLEGWPAGTDIMGVLTIENTKLIAKLDTARIFNAEMKRTVLGIDDMSQKPGVFTLASEVDARAEEVSRYLRESPLASGIGAFTKAVALEGPGRLELSMRIPLANSEEKAAAKLTNTVVGRYELNRGSAKLLIGGPQAPTISNLSGAVKFDDTGIKSTGIQGTAFGNPVTFNIASNGDSGVNGGVITEWNARAELSQLGEFLPRLPPGISGAMDFKGKVTAKDSGIDVLAESPLVGVVSTLPYPLQKRADEPRALRLQISNAGQANEKFRVSIEGNATANPTQDAPETRVDARLQRRIPSGNENKGPTIVGGIATFGEAVTEAPIPEGMWLEGSLKQLDFDAWRKVIDGYAPAVAQPAAPASAPSASATVTGAAKSDFQLAGFDLKLGQLQAYGRPFKALSMKGRRAAEDWRFVVDSEEASGDFTWRPGAYNDRGAIRARLKNFTLTEETATVTANTSATQTVPTPVPASTNETEFPALDVVADSFTLKQKWMGKLELRATPQGANWKIDQLKISNGHVNLEMDGLWQRYGDPQSPPSAGTAPSRTAMNLKVETSNLNALLGQFGFGEQVRGGKGKLEGQLSWPGHTYEFSSAKLSGSFKVEATSGAFAKVAAGPGKLLGLLSLQSLPRRISLDFRDIFSDGFAFDKINGDVKVDNGIMFTENFQIVGPAAEVTMQGDIAIPTERANLIMTIQPRLDETVALGVGLFTLNPLIGAAAFLGQKVIGNPIEKLFSQRLVVSGKWDNPEVEKLSRTPGVSPAPASAPARTPPVTPSTPVPSGSGFD